MNTYKHSGAVGDLIYGMIVAKYTNGGEFYLHLGQLDWIGQHYYGNSPGGFHQGRMTYDDFEYMKPFMLAQDYITKFEVLDPKTTAITHNLDRFRPLFVGHPMNYIDLYAHVFGLTDPAILTQPWLTVPKPSISARVVINRTLRWTPPELNAQWALWQEQGMENESIFVGLPDEYLAFQKLTGWTIPYYPTTNMLDLAQCLAGAEVFIGNQSQCYALAVGLGLPEIYCELRRDLPVERNECYFPQRTQIKYF